MPPLYGPVSRRLFSKPSFVAVRSAPWLVSFSSRRSRKQATVKFFKMEQRREYEDWSREGLMDRIAALETEVNELRNPTARPAHPAPGTTLQGPDTVPSAQGLKRKQPDHAAPKKKKAFDPSRYSTRLIALKLAYLGKNYNGFENQTSGARSTIEGELWKALVKSCLIAPRGDPDVVDWAPFEYSKCGRTDAGVSAFGQVVGIRVRSNRALEEPAGAAAAETDGVTDGVDGAEREQEQMKPKKAAGARHRRDFDPVSDEIPYARQLNRLLPPDIRVLAWCPTPPADFSARFNCRERHYKYFFTQPAYQPLPQDMEAGAVNHNKNGGRISNPRVRDGWLDIEAMRTAAKLFEGTHDFRNLCKIDPSKQIVNFERRIFSADIVEVPDAHSALPYLNSAAFPPPSGSPSSIPMVYSFDVRGTAFLWHQIRHMVAVLFAVGQGLEEPSIVSELLDVGKHPCKPNYTMADEVPLVLWDCVFPGPGDVDSGSGDAGLEWVWLGEDLPSNMYGTGGLADHLWRVWRGRKMDELLANRLLDRVVSQVDVSQAKGSSGSSTGSQRAFDGGDAAKTVGSYVPVLQKQLALSPEEANDRWARQKGFASAEELRKTGAWRAAIKAKKGGEDAMADE